MGKPFFAIYGLHGRVGSCWLAELLKPACLLDPQEIWQPYQRGKADRLGVTADPYEQPAEYLRQFCAARGVTGARAFPHYLPSPSDIKLAIGMDRVIFLYRRNVTEQMVSLMVAKRCGWRYCAQHDPARPLVLNVDNMIRTFEKANRRWREAVAAVPESKRRVVAYGDIRDRAPELREFIGLDPKLPLVKEARVQRSKDRYQRIVANLDEVNRRMGYKYGRVFGKAGVVDPAEGFADG